MREPILIWGAGAIGGTVGAYLQRAGNPVLFVDNVAEHIEAINRSGLHVSGPIDDFKVPASAATVEDLTGQFGTIFLCVKAHHTQTACDQIAPHLHNDGCVVSLQNGLNERVISKTLGLERTIGAFVNFGADYIGPGEIHFGGRGAVVVGELDGEISPRIEHLHHLLLKFDQQAVLTSNILGFLWGKMSYGALLYVTALTNEPIADVLASHHYRQLLTDLACEVLFVATSLEITPEQFDGYDPTAFLNNDPAMAVRSFEDMVAHNRRSSKTHSGIWRDLAVRKRRTEVDAQLGPVIEIGEEQGIATPITKRLIELIHDIESGNRPLDWKNLDELENTRAKK